MVMAIAGDRGGGRRRMMVEEWEEDVDVEKVAVVHVHDSVAQNS